MGAAQTIDGLPGEPTCGQARHGPPSLLGLPPLGLQIGQGSLATETVVAIVIDPEVDVECQHRLVAKKKVNPANEQIPNLMAVEDGQNVIDVHGRNFITIAGV
jgi:hypothetical protein